MSQHTSLFGSLEALLIGLNQRPFRGPEAAFYEFMAAPAVASIVTPVLEAQLESAPSGDILDVGCGGGSITAQLQRPKRAVIGSDPSTIQTSRARRNHDLWCVTAGAGALPFAEGTFSAVVSSCAVKHWPSRLEGIVECSRVLERGGRLVVVEIDGGLDDREFVRFVERTRIPRVLRGPYMAFARRTFVRFAPSASDLAHDLVGAGLADVEQWRIPGLPFLVVAGTRRRGRG